MEQKSVPLSCMTEKVFHSPVWTEKVFHCHVWTEEVFHSPVWTEKMFSLVLITSQSIGNKSYKFIARSDGDFGKYFHLPVPVNFGKWILFTGKLPVNKKNQLTP
jgi:hypothetical protein